MPEIERRFLIDDRKAAIALGRAPRHISQSYVPGTGHWAIRLRTIAMDGVTTPLLTMKLPETDMTADEHETVVTRKFHDGLLPRCGAAVEKTRSVAPASGDLTWEIDVFAAVELAVRRRDGRVETLMLAEIELPSEDAAFDVPAWLGTEVTADKRFSNFQLARRIAMVRSLTAGGMTLHEALYRNLLEEPE